MTTYTINTELNGIEINFDCKPGEETRTALKAAGYRWHRQKKVWYARNNAERLNLAQQITGQGEVTRIEGEAKKAAAAVKVADLNSINKAYTFRETGEGLYAGWTGNNAGKLSGKYGAEAKKIILAELKKNGIKATGRTGKGGYTEHFYFTVSVPAQYMKTREQFVAEKMQNPHFSGCGNAWWYDEDGTEIFVEKLLAMDTADRERIMKATFNREFDWATREQTADIVDSDFVAAVKVIVDSFNADHSNTQVDYFDVGFYTTYTWKAVA